MVPANGALLCEHDRVKVKARLNAVGAVAVVALTFAPRAGLAPPRVENPTWEHTTPGRTGPRSIPDTPVGVQLRWLLGAASHLPIADDAFSQHFAAAFGAQVTLAQLNATLSGLEGTHGLKLVRITQGSAAALLSVVEGSTQLLLSLSVDADGQINGLRFSSANPEPASWAELDRQLASIAPTVSFVAAEVTRGRDCTLRQALHATTPRPLGSLFKLYVLGALANQILEGHASWTQPIVIQQQLKSLPSACSKTHPPAPSPPSSKPPAT